MLPLALTTKESFTIYVIAHFCLSRAAVYIVVFITTLFRTPRLDEHTLDQDAEEEEEGLLASTGAASALHGRISQEEQRRELAVGDRRIMKEDMGISVQWVEVSEHHD